MMLECIWIHYSMPNLVQADVEDAVRTLYSSLDLAFSNSMADKLVLDMPQFFFVSNQVNLFCRIIILFNYLTTYFQFYKTGSKTIQSFV